MGKFNLYAGVGLAIISKIVLLGVLIHFMSLVSLTHAILTGVLYAVSLLATYIGESVLQKEQAAQLQAVMQQFQTQQLTENIDENIGQNNYHC